MDLEQLRIIAPIITAVLGGIFAILNSVINKSLEEMPKQEGQAGFYVPDRDGKRYRFVQRIKPGRARQIKIAAIAILAISAIASISIWVLSAFSPARSQLDVGAVAPDFSLADSRGNILRLSETSRNYRSVVLVFYRGYW